jgi:hypothetical protein
MEPKQSSFKLNSGADGVLSRYRSLPVVAAIVDYEFKELEA